MKMLGSLFLFTAALAAQIPNVSTMTPAYGTGTGATFQFTVNNYPNLASFQTLHVVIKPYSASPLPIQNECIITYTQVQASPVFWTTYLWNDNDTVAAEGGAEGQYYVWGSNSYCDIAAGSSHTVNGNSITFTIPVTFRTTLYGPLTIFTNVSDNSGANSGWASWGGWTAGAVAIPSLNVSGSPGTGYIGTFTVTATDAAGVSDIGYIYSYVGKPEGGPLFNCAVLMSGGNTYVMNDAGTGWTGPATSTAAAQNSQCGVRVPSYSQTANSVTYGITVTMFPTVSQGTYALWGYASGNNGLSPWAPSGAWTVPAPVGDSTLTLLPTDPSTTVLDDYSGSFVLMPTSDQRTIPEVYLTQPTTADSQPFPIGQSYTVVLNNAPPNSTVWARSSSGELNAPPYADWNPVNAISIPITGAASVGTTDATGYFSATWAAQAIPGDTTTGFWVGAGNIADPNYPPGVASQVNAATFCGQIWFYTETPSGGVGTDWTPDAAKRVRLSGGKIASIAGAPAVKVRSAPSSNFEQDSSGVYTYHFALDTRDASGSIIRVGADPDMAMKSTGENQNGWLSMGVGWIAGDSPKRAADVALSLRSRWKPGPVAIFWHGAPSSIPTTTSVDNVVMARKVSIIHDSTQQVAIGPAIKPGISEAEMRLLVRDWKDTLGFSFLAPLLASSDFSAGLDLLKPSTDMERSIVRCLRDAN